jgi:uncharacterized membrane protein
MSKAAKVFFTLSILLNIGLGGAALGHVYRMIQENPWSDIRGEVSPQTRQIMRQSYKDNYKEIWALRGEMREKKSALKKTILQDEFDDKAFTEAAKDLKSQNGKSFDARVDVFKKVLSQLPKSEREKMAQRAVDILAGHRKWDKSQGKMMAEMDGKNPFARDEEDSKDKKGKKEEADKHDSKSKEKESDKKSEDD